jgi:hypothetical protein
MGAADVAVRAQVHELGFQGALLVGGHRRPAGCRRDGLGGVGGPCVSFVEYRACPGPGLTQDLLAVTAGVDGHLFAVLLGAGHVLVGRLLGLGQDGHRLRLAVLRRGAADHPVAQPQHFGLEVRPLVHQPDHFIGGPGAELPDAGLIQPTSAQPGRGEACRPQHLRRQPSVHPVTIDLRHHALQPKSSEKTRSGGMPSDRKRSMVASTIADVPQT